MAEHYEGMELDPSEYFGLYLGQLSPAEQDHIRAAVRQGKARIEYDFPMWLARVRPPLSHRPKEAIYD